jgi:uncharacterized protein (DUF1800 family)
MSLPRRKFLRDAASGIALVAAGCDQLPRELRVLLPPPEKAPGPFSTPAGESIDAISHALNRLTFGPRPGDYGRIRKLAPTAEDAVRAFFEEQLAAEQINDDVAEFAVRRFDTLAEPLGELFEYQPKLLHDELMRAALLRAVMSERQLYEVMVEFWSNHFNIDPSKGECKWLKAADDRDVIRRHALGKFPEMLRASALSPAMLWYLDGRANRKRHSSEKPNENYARELLELHTLGVHGGYTQNDVMEVARCLTGWTVRSKENKPYFSIGKVEFKAELHDFGAKEILGHNFPATETQKNREGLKSSAESELERVLSIVTTHRSTALHIGTKLCRHFISDDPPASAVETVAGAFTRTNGNIRETLRGLFATPEFLEHRGNKLKRPFAFIASALRGLGAETDAGEPLIRYLERMGHAPFSYPTPEGYPEVAEPWLGTLLWRWNFAVALTEGQVKGTKVDLKSLTANAGGEPGVIRHILGRNATDEETKAFKESGNGTALLLACPAFQMC